MNRAHFMARLRDGLSGLHPNDIDDILADYERHFADGAAAGRSEDEVAAALGDPTRLARELRAEVGFRRWEEHRSAGNLLGVVAVLLGLATIDFMILLPLLCGLAGLFVGLAVLSLVGIVGGCYLLFDLIPLGWEMAMTNPVAQGLIGLGLVSGAVGWAAMLLWATEAIGRLLIRYGRLHFRLFDTANQSL